MLVSLALRKRNKNLKCKLKNQPLARAAYFFYMPQVHSRTYYPKQWRDLIRCIILLRDEATCYVCRKVSVSNHVHHIDDNKANCTAENLMVVCPRCHGLISHKRIVLQSGEPVIFSPFQKVFNDALLNVVSGNAPKFSTK